MQELVRLRMRPSRDNKSFRYMLDFVDEDGKRRQVSLGHTDKRKAQMQRRQKELELRTGVFDRRPMRLSVFLEDCLRRTEGQVRPSTLRENRMVMVHFIKCVGDIDIRQVQHQHGERFIRARLDKGNSPATVAKKIRHLKRLFQLAVDRDQLDVNPLRRLRQPKSPKRKVRVFSDEECRRLILAAEQYEEESRHCLPWAILVRVALCTAMRRGELLNTTWRDIDFENMTIDVAPKKETQHTWEWHIKDTDRRTLPLTPEVVRMLAEHQDRQPTGYPYVFVPADRYDHIQAQRKAGKWKLEHGICPVNNFTRRFQSVLALAGIESREFHDLRRTCLSQWLTDGLREFDVMNLAGHACFETTRTFYLSVRRDLIDRARVVSERSEERRFVARLLRAPSRCHSMQKAPADNSLEAFHLHQRARQDSNLQPSDSKSATLSN